MKSVGRDGYDRKRNLMDGMDTTGNKRIYMYIIDYTTTIGSRIVRNHVEIELWCRLLHFNGY